MTGSQKKLSLVPKVAASASVAGSSSPAVSGRKRPGTAPTSDTPASSRHGAAGLSTLCTSWCSVSTQFSETVSRA